MDYSAFIPHLYALTGASFYIIGQNNGLIYSYPFSSSEGYNWRLEIVNKSEILSSSMNRIIPVQLVPNKSVYLYLCSISDSIVIAGPACHSRLSAYEEHILQMKYDFPSSELTMVNQRSVISALTLLMSVHSANSSTHEDISNALPSLDIKPAEKINPALYQIHEIDTFQMNHSYATEKYFFDMVKSGNVDKVSDFIRNQTIIYPSPVSNSIKNEEYMSVSFITLLCRHAIEGNVPPTTAYSQSDALLKQLADCRTISEIKALTQDSAVIFTQLVKKYESMGEYSLISIKCRRLIHSGLFENITLSSLAYSLGVSKEHLATCFKKDFGITVTQYIHKKKIELACEILANSTYSVNEIAAYLSFNSTSYFIRLFQKELHITPVQYRRLYSHE